MQKFSLFKKVKRERERERDRERGRGKERERERERERTQRPPSLQNLKILVLLVFPRVCLVFDWFLLVFLVFSMVLLTSLENEWFYNGFLTGWLAAAHFDWLGLIQSPTSLPLHSCRRSIADLSIFFGRRNGPGANVAMVGDCSPYGGSPHPTDDR